MPNTSVIGLGHYRFPIPEWHRFATDGSKIQISVDKKFWKNQIRVKEDLLQHYVIHHKSDKNLREFSFKGDYFGLERSFVMKEISHGWIVFSGEIPSHQGKDKPRKIDSFAKSIQVMIELLAFPEILSGRQESQEYGISFFSGDEGVGTAGLAVNVTPTLAAKLVNQVPPTCVTENMQRAFNSLMTHDNHKWDIDEFSVNLNTYPNFSVPGSCACLGPAHPEHDLYEAVKLGEGFELSSHNNDTPRQAISLLVGAISFFEHFRTL